MNAKTALLALCCVTPLPLSADGFPDFETLTVDPAADRICYAVTVADVDGDGKTDIVAVTERAVYWYQAPDWKKRVIIADQTEPDNVCIAAHDIDGDGSIDFALGAGWTKIGTIQWLSRDDSLDKPWRIHAIGRERWLHRMRFADVLGRGRPQLVISPLNKTTGNGVRLTAFEIPDNPRVDRWRPTVLDATLNRMHNHWHTDLTGDGAVDTITASVEGVHLIQRGPDGWRRQRLGTGLPEGDATGAGEIKSGRLGNGQPFLATVEPMHGHTIAVYTPTASDKPWKRTVLESEFKRGHAVWVANLDDDPADELIVGHSDPGPGTVTGPGVFVFDAEDDEGTRWQKHVLDNGGIATEDAVATDLNGDGRVDIVAGGRATHNVRLYLNQGTPRDGN